MHLLLEVKKDVEANHFKNFMVSMFEDLDLKMTPAYSVNIRGQQRGYSGWS